MSNIEKPVYLEDKLEEIQDSGRLDYRSKALPTWCPGCGYFSIVEGMTSALNNLAIDPDETVVVSGIGCASRFPFFVNTYGFHTLHGRALPVATGIKVANEDLTVIAVGGDGDGLGCAGRHADDGLFQGRDDGFFAYFKFQRIPSRGRIKFRPVIEFSGVMHTYGIAGLRLCHDVCPFQPGLFLGVGSPVLWRHSEHGRPAETL